MGPSLTTKPSLIISSCEYLLLHLAYDPLDYHWSFKEDFYQYGPSVNVLKVRITSYISLYSRYSAYITWLSHQSHQCSIMLSSHLCLFPTHLLVFPLFFSISESQSMNLNMQEICLLLLLNLDNFYFKLSFCQYGKISVNSGFLPLPDVYSKFWWRA